MTTIINFEDIPGASTQSNPVNTTPNTVLDHAKDKLNLAIIIGIDKETESLYIASSSNDATELNLLLDVAKRHILDLFYINKPEEVNSCDQE
jgi:hypothetical protein